MMRRMSYVYHCPSCLHVPYPCVLSLVVVRGLRTCCVVCRTYIVVHRVFMCHILVCCRRSSFAVYAHDASYVACISLSIVSACPICLCVIVGRRSRSTHVMRRMSHVYRCPSCLHVLYACVLSLVVVRGLCT